MQDRKPSCPVPENQSGICPHVPTSPAAGETDFYDHVSPILENESQLAGMNIQSDGSGSKCRKCGYCGISIQSVRIIQNSPWGGYMGRIYLRREEKKSEKKND